MENYSENSELSITVTDNKTLSTSGSGDIPVNIKSQSEKKMISNILYVSNLNANFLSVSALANKDFVLVFDKLNCKLYRESDIQIKREVVATTKKDGLYTLDTDSSPKTYNAANRQEIVASIDSHI